MATLPPTTNITSSSATEGDAKVWFAGIRTFIDQMLGSDGLVATALQKLLAPFNSTLIKTGAYTVVAADRGKVIKCTGTWTLSAQSITALGDGFMFLLWNAGTGVITFDPSLAEPVDEALTMAINPKQMVAFYCDGSGWKAFGKGGVESFNTRSGVITLTSADVSAVLTSGMVVTALGYSPVSKDLGGAAPIGTMARVKWSGGVGAGGTGDSAYDEDGSTILPGTWRNLSTASKSSGEFGPAQRIA